MPCGGFFMFLLLGVMRANLPHYWDNNFLTTASNAMCIKIFSHSGCWEYQLFLILCQPWGLLCPLLSVILSPDPDSSLICKPRSVFQSRFEEIPLQSSGDIYTYNEDMDLCSSSLVRCLTIAASLVSKFWSLSSSFSKTTRF